MFRTRTLILLSLVTLGDARHIELFLSV
jgi:hypothetical protein